MAVENRPSVHTDFRLLHHPNDADCDGQEGVAQLLRKVWLLPLDTYVTEDMPLLLTLLSIPERRPARAVKPRDGEAIPKPAPSIEADHETSWQGICRGECHGE